MLLGEKADRPKLFALLDPQKKCTPVIAPDWSPYMEYEPNTVGRQAGFLISFFRTKGIPGSGCPVGLGLDHVRREQEGLEKVVGAIPRRKRLNPGLYEGGLSWKGAMYRTIQVYFAIYRIVDNMSRDAECDRSDLKLNEKYDPEG
jgi:hypothetical protein